jgi:hypothetical protein
MKLGERFYTIAYTSNTRVIEVEVIEIKDIDGATCIHIQNVKDNFDKWFLPEVILEQWKFDTKKLAENKLKELE